MAMRAVLISALVASATAAITFPNTPFPTTDAQKHSVLHPLSVVIGRPYVLEPVYGAGMPEGTATGGFVTIARTNDTLDGVTLGLLHSASGNVVYEMDDEFNKTVKPDVSVNPDFQSYIHTEGEVVHSFVHFESPVPSTIYYLKLVQDPVSGQLSAASMSYVDWSAWGGLWIPCAGSLSPWNTHLGSEEYEPDARSLVNATSFDKFIEQPDADVVVSFARYFDLYPGDFANKDDYLTLLTKFFNPYRYGHITEVSMLPGSESWKVAKWFTLGRLSHEAAKVMPDNRTLYLTDDGNYNRVLFKFVADTPSDLSAGTLYAAKLKQVTPKGGPIDTALFEVSWVFLSRGQQQAIAEIIDSGVTFADIFDYMDAPADATCPEGYTFANTTRAECLKLKPGMQIAAAFLESRRYAAMMGATAEFVKMEGVSLSPARMTLYIVLSSIGASNLAVDGSPSDDIQVTPNKCGCVMQLMLDSEYSAVSMKALTCGVPTEIFPNNTCHQDYLAQPDNVHVVLDQDALVIGEDGSGHLNNMLWWYNLQTGDMTRMLNAPAGAEVTSAYSYTINGYHYYVANLQHPLEEEYGELAEAAKSYTGTAGYIGYVGPVLSRQGEGVGFENTNVPMGTEVFGVHASRAVTLGLKQNTTYNIVLRTGDKYPSGTYGMLVNYKGEAVEATPLDYSWDTVDQTPVNQPAISANVDALILMPSCNGTYLVNHFETQQPAAMYISKLFMDANGKFKAVDTMPSDWRPYENIWNPCAASLTAIGTRIGGEEYEPDARAVEDSDSVYVFTNTSADTAAIGMYMRWFNKYSPDGITLENIQTEFHPYLFGYNVETTLDPKTGVLSNVKHMATSRASHELGYLMPDGKTLYSTDDGTNVGFYRFVADKAYDLSSGTLYMAKMIQLTNVSGGEFILQWIELGNGNNTYLLSQARTTKFSDLFETAEPTEVAPYCPPGFTSINGYNGARECLKPVLSGLDRAPFYETRRYGQVLGATAEFSKMEGLTYDKLRNKLYMTVTEIRYGMEDWGAKGENSSKYDLGGHNHIRLPFNPCGCVYELELTSNYMAYSLRGLLCGMKDTSVENNTCAINHIANPDNVAMIYGHDQLFIQEDTEAHENDVGWIYDLTTKQITRIITSPYGSEVTGGYFFPNIGGYGYLTVAVQHPYGEGTGVDHADEPGWFGKPGAAGYFGPFTMPAEMMEDDSLTAICTSSPVNPGETSKLSP